MVAGVLFLYETQLQMFALRFPSDLKHDQQRQTPSRVTGHYPLFFLNPWSPPEYSQLCEVVVKGEVRSHSPSEQIAAFKIFPSAESRVSSPLDTCNPFLLSGNPPRAGPKFRSSWTVGLLSFMPFILSEEAALTDRLN